MNPIYSIAIKNIKANKKRSFVTIFLTMCSTAILIFISAFMDGSHNKMLQNAVELYSGYIQVSHKDFKSNPSFDNLIFNRDKTINTIEKNDGVELVSSRFEAFVLLSSLNKSVGVSITSIEPLKEERLSILKNSLVKGEYLNSKDENYLYIGFDLAKRLKVDVGDKLSFVGTGADYSFCADIVKVKGIFQTGLYEFDSNSAFLNQKYFDEVFVSSNLATSLIVLPKKPKEAELLSDNINKIIDKELVSQSWKKFMESFVKAMELDSIFGYFTIAIFFVVIFFVILIYTLLVVYSRIKEIGVLRAIGTTKNQILKMLIFESVVLSTISVIIGGIIGAYLAYYFSINPIELGDSYNEQFKQYGLMATSLPTEFNLVTIFRDMFIMFVLNILSTLYPILNVNRYKPVEATNHV